MNRRALGVLACACVAALAATHGAARTSAAFTATASVAGNSVTVDRLANYLRVMPGRFATGTVDTLSIDLGVVRGAASITDVFTVTNSTTAPVDATLTLFGVPQIAAASLTPSGTAGGTLAPGQSALVTVLLSPETAGHGSGTLRLGLTGSTWLYRDYPIRIVVAPRPPAALTASPRAGGRIALAWTAPSTTTLAGYAVYRSSGDAYERIASLQPGQSTFDDTTTVDGTSYAYRVRAVAADDPALESLDSPTAAATADATPPPAPRSVSLVRGGHFVNGAMASSTSVAVVLDQPAAPGDTITVTLGGTVRGTAAAGAATTWTAPGLDVRELPDGPITIDAAVTDAAGNMSVATAIQVTKDTVPPGAPAAVYLDAKNKKPDGIAGTTEPGATVTAVQTVPVSSGPYTVVADAAGFFELVLPASRKESVVYVVTATDAAGNTGPATILHVDGKPGKGPDSADGENDDAPPEGVTAVADTDDDAPPAAPG